MSNQTQQTNEAGETLVTVEQSLLLRLALAAALAKYEFGADVAQLKDGDVEQFGHTTKNPLLEGPPPGPSNILVRGASPLPAPKDVRNQ